MCVLENKIEKPLPPLPPQNHSVRTIVSRSTLKENNNKKEVKKCNIWVFKPPSFHLNLGLSLMDH